MTVVVSVLGLASCLGCVPGFGAAPKADTNRTVTPQAAEAMPGPRLEAVISGAPTSSTQVFRAGVGWVEPDAPYYAITPVPAVQLKPEAVGSGLSLLPREQTSLARLNSPEAGLLLDSRQTIDAGIALTAPRAVTGLGFDVEFRPRAQITELGDQRLARAGAQVRLGSSLSDDDANDDSWYFFAGADGQALVWDLDQTNRFDLMDSVRLKDRITVGDVQAGVSILRAGGQMSFGYVRREFSFEDMRRAENFVAFTASWKH
jgi:hypothetical protein